MERLRQQARAELAKQTSGIDPAEVTKLAFTDVPLLDSAELSSALFPKLHTLSLVGMKPALKSAAQLATQFPSLRALDVSDNHIEEIPAGFTIAGLVRLTLANNRITSTGALAALAAGCPKLEVLDCFMNPVAEGSTKAYREGVFALCPALQVLDDHRRDGREVDVESYDGGDEEGEGEDDEEEESSSADDDEEEEGDSDDDTGSDAGVDDGTAERPLKHHRTE
jgi:Leucine-rich repeat (LRR) protein